VFVAFLGWFFCRISTTLMNPPAIKIWPMLALIIPPPMAGVSLGTTYTYTHITHTHIHTYKHTHITHTHTHIQTYTYNTYTYTHTHIHSGNRSVVHDIPRELLCKRFVLFRSKRTHRGAHRHADSRSISSSLWGPGNRPYCSRPRARPHRWVKTLQSESNSVFLTYSHICIQHICLLVWVDRLAQVG
jgi:hypothetical protein